MIFAAVILFFADWTTPAVQKRAGSRDIYIGLDSAAAIGHPAAIAASLVMVRTLYIMNGIAEVHSKAAEMSNFEFPEGATLITSLVDGGNWLIYRKNTNAWQRAAGYSEGE